MKNQELKVRNRVGMVLLGCQAYSTVLYPVFQWPQIIIIHHDSVHTTYLCMHYAVTGVAIVESASQTRYCTVLYCSLAEPTCSNSARLRGIESLHLPR